MRGSRSMMVVACVVMLAGCMQDAPSNAQLDAATPGAAIPAATRPPASTTFAPPADSAIPDGPLGDVIRQGRDIFTDTRTVAAAYAGDGLVCSNCHLDAGRTANTAPLWGAYPLYPQYRAKNRKVNTFGERLQDCFVYSMNGVAPPLGSDTLVALEAYAAWLATGAPLGTRLPGAGYATDAMDAALPPDYARGQVVFQNQCAMCHGAAGLGQQASGTYSVPPLWGSDAYNWGAGMADLGNASAFIKAKMPYGRGGTLSNQQAWDVAMFVNSHERPQDPRYTGNVAATRKAFHDSPQSLYGTRTPDGALLGSSPAPRGAGGTRSGE